MAYILVCKPADERIEEGRWLKRGKSVVVEQSMHDSVKALTTNTLHHDNLSIVKSLASLSHSAGGKLRAELVCHTCLIAALAKALPLLLSNNRN